MNCDKNDADIRYVMVASRLSYKNRLNCKRFKKNYLKIGSVCFYHIDTSGNSSVLNNLVFDITQWTRRRSDVFFFLNTS